MDFFTLPDDPTRRVIAQAMLDMSFILLENDFDLDHVRIANCLTLARIDREMLDFSEIAKRTRVPRPTVIRKVKAWESAGMVTTQRRDGHTYVLPTRLGATHEQAVTRWRELERVLLEAAERLSARPTGVPARKRA